MVASQFNFETGHLALANYISVCFGPIIDARGGLLLSKKKKGRDRIMPAD